MTDPTSLSPAAQAVLDAFLNGYITAPDSNAAFCADRNALAAALRAAADQLKLEAPLGDTDADAGVFAAYHAICTHLLAIAAELEGADN